jgi:hypothetical protein
MRYLNDVTATYKANDKLTLTTDVNYIEEDSVKPSATASRNHFHPPPL